MPSFSQMVRLVGLAVIVFKVQQSEDGHQGVNGCGGFSSGGFL